MPSSTFTLSSALCLILAVAPTSVFSAPQLNGLPILGGNNDVDNTPSGHDETDAGAGFNVGIPDGPAVNFGAGVHTEHNGPCGPGHSSVHDAGAGYSVGIPDGPGVHYGAGVHDQHDAIPCPEIIEDTPPPPPATATVILPPPTAEVVAPPPPPPPQVPSEEAETYVPSFIPPTYTTPIVIPTITTPAMYAPPPMVPVTSTPLMSYPIPSSTPVAQQPAFNAGSVLSPRSLLVVALPVILGFFA